MCLPTVGLSQSRSLMYSVSKYIFQYKKLGMSFLASNRTLQTVIVALSILTISCIFLFTGERMRYITLKKERFMHHVENVNSIHQLRVGNFTTESSILRPPSTTSQVAKIDPDALQEEALKKLKKSTDKKIILVWYKKGMGNGNNRINAERCGNCEISRNQSMITDKATAAVVFYYMDIAEATMPPLSSRNPKQLYVFWNKEPTPLMRYVHRKELDFEEKYQFNATMTYRRDSDFYNNYRYQWVIASLKSKRTLKDILSVKNKTSIAIFSDCDWTAGARIRFKILHKIKDSGFPMDGFGKCFPEGGTFPIGDDQMFNKVRVYKFFFAFENSYHCADYITEKFFRNSLYAGVVPVVFGSKKEHYEVIAPPGSFIFVEDYDTIEDLLEYLKYLDKNETAYSEYLRWRFISEKEATPYNSRVPNFCHLCRTLHGVNIDDLYNPKYDPKRSNIPIFTDGVAVRFVPSLKHYLFEDEDPMCMERNETLLPVYKKFKLDV